MVTTEITRTYCPKCGGSLYLDRDLYGWYEQCLNCGFTRDLRTVVAMTPEKAAPAKREKRVAAAKR